jgi:hypothetical protein
MSEVKIVFDRQERFDPYEESFYDDLVGFRARRPAEAQVNMAAR